jgi:hypothetical protein
MAAVEADAVLADDGLVALREFLDECVRAPKELVVVVIVTGDECV